MLLRTSNGVATTQSLRKNFVKVTPFNDFTIIKIEYLLPIGRALSQQWTCKRNFITNTLYNDMHDSWCIKPNVSSILVIFSFKQRNALLLTVLKVVYLCFLSLLADILSHLVLVLSGVSELNLFHNESLCITYLFPVLWGL